MASYFGGLEPIDYGLEGENVTENEMAQPSHERSTTAPSFPSELSVVSRQHLDLCSGTASSSQYHNLCIIYYPLTTLVPHLPPLYVRKIHDSFCAPFFVVYSSFLLGYLFTPLNACAYSLSTLSRTNKAMTLV